MSLRIRSNSAPRRLVLHGLAVAAVALASPALWAQSLTLHVPSRGPATEPQNAATSIEFDAASLTGAASISVAGTAVPVPASPCAGVACGAVGATAEGDVIKVTRISGSNRVRLDVTYQSLFNANYCAPKPHAGVDRAIELTGFTFGAGKGYRITSFMAPIETVCDLAYVRVPNNRPNLTGAGVDYLGRLPLDLVLVLDKSPSMAWTIPGQADIRWDRLKSSVQLFATVWDAIGAPPAPSTESSEGHPEDRLGVVLFGGSAVETSLDGNFFKARGNSPAPWSAPVAATLVDNTFIGGTSVGAGIALARTKLSGGEDVIGRSAVVVFTDGEQNTPACIVRETETLSPTVKPYPNQPPGTTYTDQCTVAAAASADKKLTLNGGVLAQGLPRGPVYTIGLGEGASAASGALLDEISKETAGQPFFAYNGPSMDSAFVDHLVSNLKGGTVSLLDRTAGQLSGSNQTSAPYAFKLDPSLTRATFVLSWDGRGREAGLDLIAPNGNPITGAQTAGGANFRVVTINLPSNGPPGEWKVAVRRYGTADMSYQLSAYGVESRLGLQVRESAKLGTGNVLKIATTIGWDHGPLTDLPAGAVRAIIERPDANLGNLLHDSAGQAIEGKIPDDASPLAMRLRQLFANQGFLDKIQPKPLADAIELKHTGFGRYEGSFDGIKVGGQYRVRIEYEWNDPRTGEIRRRDYIARQALVIPDANSSLVTVKRDGRDTFIVITPRDKFGNYVGPGFENGFSVKLDAGTVAGPPSDHGLGGDYSIRVTGLNDGDDPKVTIVFADQTLRDGPLSSIGGNSGEPPAPAPWWKRWWWLILIVLLLLFLLLRRK